MTAVLELLRSALSDLEEAQAKANLGTSIMIRTIADELRELIDRTDKIQDDNE